MRTATQRLAGALLLALILGLGAWPAMSNPAQEGSRPSSTAGNADRRAPRVIKFTTADAEVLQRVRNIRELGLNGAKLMLSAPVVALLASMTDPVEFSVTLYDSDFAAMLDGARTINKLAACLARDRVLEHIEAGLPAPVGPPKAYFEHIQAQANRRCDA